MSSTNLLCKGKHDAGVRNFVSNLVILGENVMAGAKHNSFDLKAELICFVLNVLVGEAIKYHLFDPK